MNPPLAPEWRKWIDRRDGRLVAGNRHDAQKLIELSPCDLLILSTFRLSSLQNLWLNRVTKSGRRDSNSRHPAWEVHRGQLQNRENVSVFRYLNNTFRQAWCQVSVD